MLLGIAAGVHASQGRYNVDVGLRVPARHDAKPAEGMHEGMRDEDGAAMRNKTIGDASAEKHGPAPFSESLSEATLELASTAQQLEAAEVAAKAKLLGLQEMTANQTVVIVGCSLGGVAVIALLLFFCAKVEEATKLDEDALYVKMLDNRHSVNDEQRADTTEDVTTYGAEKAKLHTRLTEGRNTLTVMAELHGTKDLPGAGRATGAQRPSVDHRGVPQLEATAPRSTASSSPYAPGQAPEAPPPGGTPRTTAGRETQGKGWQHEKGGEGTNAHRERLKREQKKKEKEAEEITIQLD